MLGSMTASTSPGTADAADRQREALRDYVIRLHDSAGVQRGIARRALGTESQSWAAADAEVRVLTAILSFMDRQDEGDDPRG